MRLMEDVTVSQNDIVGALIGVLVDENVLDATLKSNILTGDAAAASGDIGVCSDAASNTIRANKIKKYTTPVDDVSGMCTILASPAAD